MVGVAEKTYLQVTHPLRTLGLDARSPLDFLVLDRLFESADSSRTGLGMLASRIPLPSIDGRRLVFGARERAGKRGNEMMYATYGTS